MNQSFKFVYDLNLLDTVYFDFYEALGACRTLAVLLHTAIWSLNHIEMSTVSIDPEYQKSVYLTVHAIDLRATSLCWFTK